MLFDLLEMALPMLFMVCAGMLCRKSGLVRAEAIDGMKVLVTNILLPLVVVKSYASIAISTDLIWIFLVATGIHLLAFLIGWATRRAVPEFPQYYPFLLSSSETGMIGYAMIAMVYGPASMSYLALFDLCGAPFFYAVFFPFLNRAIAVHPQPILRTLLRTPIMWALAAGVLLNVSGVAAALSSTPWAALFAGFVATVTAPITGLIFFVVGYNIAIDRALIWPVLKTSLMRLAVMAGLCALGTLVFDRVGLADPMYKYAMYITFALPASYLCCIFAQKEDAQRYIGTQLSLHAILAIVVAMALKALT